MGLDSVEIVMGCETAFGISISDEAAVAMVTPRDTVDYVAARLKAAPTNRCITRHVFYRLRRGLRAARGEADAYRPSTRLRALASGRRDWDALWLALLESVGEPGWPGRVPWKQLLCQGPESLRELAVHVGMHLPPPNPKRGEAWTRERVELAVRRVIWDVIEAKGFRLDAEYVRDLGVS